MKNKVYVIAIFSVAIFIFILVFGIRKLSNSPGNTFNNHALSTDTVIVYDTIKIADLRVLYYFKEARDSAVKYAIDQVDNLFFWLKDRITDSFLDSCMNVLSFKEKHNPFMKNKDLVAETRIKALFEQNVLRPYTTDSELRDIITSSLEKYIEVLSSSELFRDTLKKTIDNHSTHTNLRLKDSLITLETSSLPDIGLTFSAANLIKNTFLKEKEKWYKRFATRFAKRFFKSGASKGFLSMIPISSPYFIALEFTYDIARSIINSTRSKKQTKEILRMQFHHALERFRNSVLYDRETGILKLIDEYEYNLINELIKLQSGNTELEDSPQ